MFEQLIPQVVKGAKLVTSFATKNSPTIMTTIAVCSFGGAMYSAVKSVKKVMAIKEEAEEELSKTKKDEDIKKIKRAAAIKVLKIVIVPIIFSLISVSCTIGSNVVNLRRQSALAAAYAISEQTLKDYDQKLEEVLGYKKAEKVREKVAETDMKRHMGERIYECGGDTLFFEPKTGRWFRSTYDKVRLVFTEARASLNGLEEDYITLNNVLENLGLEIADLGNVMGWNQGEDISINLNQTTLYSDKFGHEEPACYMSYSIRPLKNVYGDLDWHSFL